MIDLVELVGYVASLLVVLSLLMSSVLRLRTISLTGALVFGTYGVLIGSIPVVATNVAILLVNLFHLRRLLRDRSEGYFEVVDWPVHGVYLPRFLDFHRDDIERFQPDFAGLRDDHTALVVLRDAVPVGTFLLRGEGPTATIDLDYVTPAHRDLRPAAQIYDSDGPLCDRGYTRLETTALTDAHRRYLERVGFAPEGDVWGLEIA